MCGGIGLEAAGCRNDCAHVLRRVLVAAAERAGNGVDDDQDDLLPSRRFDFLHDADDRRHDPQVAKS